MTVVRDVIQDVVRPVIGSVLGGGGDQGVIDTSVANQITFTSDGAATTGATIANLQWRIYIPATDDEILIEGTPGAGPSSVTDTRSTATLSHVTGNIEAVTLLTGAANADLVGDGDLDVWLQVTDSFGVIQETKKYD